MQVHSEASFSTFIMLCSHHLYLVPRHCHNSKMKLRAISNHPPFLHPSVPRWPLIRFLSLWICLVGIFHIKEIIQHVDFCVCDFFFHLASCVQGSFTLWYVSVTHSFSFGWTIAYCMDISYLVSCFHILIIKNSAAMNIHPEVFVCMFSWESQVVQW